MNDFDAYEMYLANLSKFLRSQNMESDARFLYKIMSYMGILKRERDLYKSHFSSLMHVLKNREREIKRLKKEIEKIERN